MLTEAFVQRALLAALFLAPLCALLGVFVTARRMAFFSDTIAHAALTGVAIALWLGASDPSLPMILFSAVVAMAMLWLKENTELLTDSIMALLLSGSVALGIMILSLTHTSPGNLHRYLFGDILSVSWGEVRIAGVAAVVIAAVILKYLNPLALASASDDLARASGLPVRALNYLFVGVLTLSVTLSIRLLGVILVTSLLVVPASAARNISRSLRQQIAFSVLIGLVSGIGGTLISCQTSVTSGPAIVLTAIACFAATLAAARFMRGNPSRPA